MAASAAAEVQRALSDRYIIEREIGRGGMATVYLAQDTKHGRPVAIKVLHADLARSLGADRFLREIGIAARLAHPYIVPLIDSGEADGILYFVAPYVTGGSLRDRLDRDPRLSEADALRITHDIASGLDYVHRSGFVHRDVKPANILFADGHAVLADFGVAHIARRDDTRPITDQGLVVGTPAYMSPEQASGERELDARSDIYSLACVVYEMLAGEPPFTASTLRGVIAKHVTAPPPALRAVRPDARVAVERAITRALAKDPSARFASVVDFAAALDADPPPDHRATATRIQSIAVLPFVNASSDAENEYFSDGITDELIDALAKVDGLRVASRTSVFALKNKPLDVRAIGVLLGTSEVLEGTVRKVGNHLRITAQLTSTADGRLLWSHRYDRMLGDVFALQDEIACTIVATLQATSLADLAPPPTPRAPPTTSVKAYNLYLRGRFASNKRTQADVAEGIKYFEAAIAEDPNYAAPYSGLSDAYTLQVDYWSIPVGERMALAKSYAHKAIALQDTLAEAHASLAWCLFIYDWQWADADAEFRRAIELDPRYASAHNWYAFLLIAQRRVEDALVEGHVALELDPASVSIRRSLGWLYYYAHRYDRAEDHLVRAITMNPESAVTYRLLGLTYVQRGEHAEAERVLREALELPDAGAYTLANLGFALGRAGNHAGAEQTLDQLRAMAARQYVSPVAFASVYLGLGAWDAARPWVERAYDERRGWMAYLHVNPMLDAVRDDPSFQSIVARMGL
jgi:eukaryotic-like serine/threonine-protein kinase